MIRASPVDMRKALEVVEVFKQAGLLFVPMPVRDAEDHVKRIAEMNAVIDEIASPKGGT